MTDIVNRTVDPRSEISGSLQVPGDKSISHRVAMLTSLGEGESTIQGYLVSQDCLHTLNALESLGAGTHREGASVQRPVSFVSVVVRTGMPAAECNCGGPAVTAGPGSGSCCPERCQPGCHRSA